MATLHNVSTHQSLSNVSNIAGIAAKEITWAPDCLISQSTVREVIVDCDAEQWKKRVTRDIALNDQSRLKILELSEKSDDWCLEPDWGTSLLITLFLDLFYVCVWKHRSNRKAIPKSSCNWMEWELRKDFRHCKSKIAMFSNKQSIVFTLKSINSNVIKSNFSL